MKREIPIITDELANPEFGTGAVKVTPAHDANDFQAGLRHNLPQIDVMDEHAHMNENSGPYAGLSRHAARERVLEDLRKAGVPNLRVEGMPHCDWVLIDAGDVIVHVFRPEVRAFYSLEKMWEPGSTRGRRAS